ncbi:hypothetical protein UFOVP218_108 [uncultured Caudovirales phage]|uniref:Uncharacterized protein n=1 Tax=uncultured Caudovirales phage TaxID=2100421 RepID=A0A6J7WKZ3_9CAUD|nr:hypothetical protein UFOVP218_108 [uncultured Caudovirales phage]
MASKSKTSYYSNYKASSKWQSNRKRKLLKQLKLQPNNEQVKDALVNIKYRRKTPSQKAMWSKTNIRTAKLFKLFTGKASVDLFSSNPKTQAFALMQKTDNTHRVKVDGKVSFSLGARAHDARGRLVWI